MGAVYSVEAKLMFEDMWDEGAFCMAAGKVMVDDLKGTGGYDYVGISFASAKDAFNALTARNGRESYADPEVWVADFDANYSWGGLMITAFEKAIAHCKDGSYVYIEADNDLMEITKKDGVVNAEWR